MVGAGITGLSCAHALSSAGTRVLVLEAEERVGGCIQTTSQDGFVLECGPHTLRDTSGEVLDHFESLGLGDEVVEISSAGARRYIVRNGRLVELPGSPLGFITSPFLSPLAKLRLFAEPFVGTSGAPDPSLGDFIAHRLGPEVRDGPLDAFVGGVWAGDPTAISARAVAPDMVQGVERHGSLLRYGLARRKARGGEAPSSRRARMFTLQDGLSRWPERLAETLGAGAVRLGARVERLEEDGIGWQVHWIEGGRRRTTKARSVVLSVGPAAAASIAGEHAPPVRAGLGAIRSASLSVVHLGFEADDVSLPDGFGVLVPRREGRDGLGILFVSTLLPNRAPDGRVTTTSFFGGIRAPEWVDRGEAELCAAARREHRELLGIDAHPVMCHVQRWHGAIPQYEFASEPLADALERYERTQSTLHFAGRYRGGVSVPDCWRRGRKVADAILAAPPPESRAQRNESMGV